jgi:hypothetical protein
VSIFGGEEEDLGEMDCSFVCGLGVLEDPCPCWSGEYGGEEPRFFGDCVFFSGLLVSI